MANDRLRFTQKVLDRHRQLEWVEKCEPAKDEAGMPLDSQAWLRWVEEWIQAVNNVQAALRQLGGETGDEISRHRMNYVPYCNKILEEQG